MVNPKNCNSTISSESNVMVKQQNLTNEKYKRVFETKVRSSIERILDERLLLTLTLLKCFTWVYYLRKTKTLT